MQIKRDPPGMGTWPAPQQCRLHPLQQNTLFAVVDHLHGQANLLAILKRIGTRLVVVIIHDTTAVDDRQRHIVQAEPRERAGGDRGCQQPASSHRDVHGAWRQHPLGAHSLPHGDDQRHHRHSVTPTSVIQPMQNTHSTSFPASRRLIATPSKPTGGGKGPNTKEHTMTTTMSMTERHKRVEELVMQDPLVRERASKFSDAQADISRWHVTNKTALRATIGQLDELDELIEYSEFCLEDLKCAKHSAYKHVMAQYPHVWDTTCPDPFTTDTQDKAEEMVTIRKDDAVDALVNIYGGHIDQWLEALRDRTHAQTDAADVRTPCACAMCTTLDKDSEDTDTKPTLAERAAYFAARDHADDADTPDAPGRRTAVRIVAYDAHKGGCHEADHTDVPVWLLDTRTPPSHAMSAKPPCRRSAPSSTT